MSILKAFVLEVQAEVMKSFRAPEFAIPTIIFPLVFYSVFGVMLGNGGQQATYLLATFGVFSVMGPSMFGFGVGVAFAFLGFGVDEDRAVLVAIADIAQDRQELVEVMAIDGADIVKAHFLEKAAAPGCDADAFFGAFGGVTYGGR